MAKKMKPLNPKVARQIEILQKYYDIDVDKRVINFVLYYEKASDILVNDVTTLGDAPRFNNDVLRRVSEILDTFPLEFKVNLSIQIDDYEGYSPEALLESLKDALEMFNYTIYRSKGINWFTAAMLAFVSMALIFLRIFAAEHGIINPDGMFYEVVDIVAWVFLWQAVTIMFLTPQEFRSISFKIMHRLLSVGFMDKDKNALIVVKNEHLEEEWMRETKKEKVGRILSLIGGTAFITVAVANLAQFIANFGDAVNVAILGEPSLFSFIVAFIDLLSFVVFAIGGIGAIAVHRGKGPFRRAVKVFAVLSLIVATLDIAVCVYQEYVLVSSGIGFSGILLVDTLIIAAVSIIYFLGYILVRISATDSTNIVEDDM